MKPSVRPASPCRRKGRTVAERWWAVRWHVLRVVFSGPFWLGMATLDGLRAFWHAFGDTWSQRWRATDRREAWRRFGPMTDRKPGGKCPCGTTCDQGQIYCPSCLEHGEAD